MSRFKRFAHSVATGYLLVGANALYTLASVPLALHYLSRDAFGLWALVMQISGYLMLIDLGMAGSISRILIDHKDNPETGAYGSIIKTGALVLFIQGLIILVGGCLLSYWLPDLFAVSTEYRHDFQLLVAGQCLIMGATFTGRVFIHVLQAHQRFDAINYAQAGGLLFGLAAMWFGFATGAGLYSLLEGYAAGTLFGVIATLLAVGRLKLMPHRGNWGHANRKTFDELFTYGKEIFLLSVGLQLTSASQVMVISRTLGLGAAAVWSIATKSFSLTQQVVFRPLDFSGSAMAEMMVRQERDRLLTRFRDLVILSASLAVWAALSVALCNHSFLWVWTKGRITWSHSSDWLMALLIICYSITRCYIGFTGLTKQIRRMKYVYFCEGLLFVVLSLLAAPIWGLNGVIGCALGTNLLCSGVYGFWRTKEYFQLSRAGLLLAWLRWPLWCLISLSALFGTVSWLMRAWDARLQLAVQIPTAMLIGGAVFWQIGLSPSLRAEAGMVVQKLRRRFGT